MSTNPLYGGVSNNNTNTNEKLKDELSKETQTEDKDTTENKSQLPEIVFDPIKMENNIGREEKVKNQQNDKEEKEKLLHTMTATERLQHEQHRFKKKIE